MTPGWRTPAVVLTCGSLILMLSIGLRQAFGLFLAPLSSDLGVGRETFAFAIALQNLVWGLGQPFAGMIADRFGAARMLVLGGLCYALGLAAMALGSGTVPVSVSAGLLVGLGLSGAGFGVVMGVIGRTFDASRRSLALGIAGAGGSFGQFVMLPYTQGLIDSAGWPVAAMVLAVTAGLIVPLAAALRGNGASSVEPLRSQSIGAALAEAGAHRGFWLLSFSFFVCGFQTVFLMVHFPAFLVDAGMTPATGMAALALMGLVNIPGSYLCGWLGGRHPKRLVLTGLYVLRTVSILLYLAVPVSAASTVLFGIAFGLTFLGTVPVTNALVAQIFGVRYLSTLFGIAFFAHQLGGFLGAWSGGWIFDASGSYTVVWLVCAGLSAVAALACWPIDERYVGGTPVRAG